MKQCETSEDNRLRWPFFILLLFSSSLAGACSLGSGIGMLDSVAVIDRETNVRVLIGECGAIVDLVVDDQVEVLLGVVLGDLLQGEFLDFRHGELRYLKGDCRCQSGFCIKTGSVKRGMC